MVLVFGSFILGGERIIELFGLGLAGAVLLDALIVRMILVPGLMLARRQGQLGLPRSLDRLLPHLNVEGSVDDRAARDAGRPVEPHPATRPAPRGRAGLSGGSAGARSGAGARGLGLRGSIVMRRWACASRREASTASGVGPAGEEEAEVAVALRQRHDRAPARDRDLEAADARHAARLFLARDLDERARPGDRNHHHAGRRRLAREVIRVEAEGVAQDQLLEADADAEAQRARAQSADRAGRDLEHADARAVDAQLRVDRPLAQARARSPTAR